MILRPFLYEPTSCARFLFGCTSRSRLAVADAHADLVDASLHEAERIGAEIVAVFETHVQADHVSGLPAPVEATRRDAGFVLGALAAGAAADAFGASTAIALVAGLTAASGAWVGATRWADGGRLSAKPMGDIATGI